MANQAIRATRPRAASPQSWHWWTSSRITSSCTTRPFFSIFCGRTTRDLGENQGSGPWRAFRNRRRDVGRARQSNISGGEALIRQLAFGIEVSSGKLPGDATLSVAARYVRLFCRLAADAPRGSASIPSSRRRCRGMTPIVFPTTPFSGTNRRHGNHAAVTTRNSSPNRYYRLHQRPLGQWRDGRLAAL